MHRKDAGAAAMPVHGTAAAKVILLGEHAAVYGRHALALPIPGAVEASVSETRASTRLVRIEGSAAGEVPVTGQAEALLDFVLQRLDIADRNFEVRLRMRIPPAMGLGSSAAVAVAVVRAFYYVLGLKPDDAAVDLLAFECEKLAHGQPSGIDNTVATYGKPVLFCNSAPRPVQVVELAEPPPLVVAASGFRGDTREQVAAVRARFEKNRERYNAIFDQIDAISVAGAEALTGRNYDALGRLMNICHGLLNALQVSTPDLEKMVAVARSAGAVGAKLTGAGGGGSIVALCPGTVDDVERALQGAGYRLVRMTGK
jgi:hydroxymethylglutaryl-CoA reductase